MSDIGPGKRPKSLSPTQIDLVLYMRAHGNRIIRHPGGFWADEKWTLHSGCLYFGTPTVHALVTKGVLAYSVWNKGRTAPFPIEATIRDKAEPVTARVSETAKG